MSQAFTVKDDVIVSASFLVCSELLRTDSLQNSGKLLSGCHGRFAEWPPRAARQRIITLLKYTFLNSEAFEFSSDEVNPHFRTSLFCRKSCYRIVVRNGLPKWLSALCPTLWDHVEWTAARQASLSLTISRRLPKFMPIASVMPSSHLILWHPLLLPSIFPSIRDFYNESAFCIGWPNYWSFTFSISPSNEYSGFISVKIDWFELLAVQGTLRSLLHHHNLKATIRVGNCNPLPYPCLEINFHEQRTLAGYSPWGCKGSDITEHIAIHVRFHSLENLSFLYGMRVSKTIKCFHSDLLKIKAHNRYTLQ